MFYFLFCFFLQNKTKISGDSKSFLKNYLFSPNKLKASLANQVGMHCEKYGVHKLAIPQGIEPKISGFIKDQA